MEDYSEFERAAKEGQRKRAHNRYMNSALALRFSEQRRGDPFEIPEDIDELELMVGWFFDRLRVIVSIENMSFKFDGVRQILDILHDAAKVEHNSAKFVWVNGQWYISYIETKEDVLDLPKVLRRFSKIYRHHANDYSYGDDEKLHILPSGQRGHLTTEEEHKNRSGF